MEARTCYFNEVFNLYLFDENFNPDNWIKTELQYYELEGYGRMRLTKYACNDLEFYTFGLFADDPKKRPGHGGEWSSNPMTVKYCFGIDLVNLSLNGFSVHMEYSQIFKLFNPEVYEKEQDLRYVTGLLAPSIKEPIYQGWYDKDGAFIK